MIECFFGSTLENEKIDGLSIADFVNKLNFEMFSLVGDFFYILFGIKFVKWGFRHKDRDLLRKIKIVRGWGSKLVEEKMQEIQQKIEKEEALENPNDLIEAIVRNNLKEKKEGGFFYESVDILNEFQTFFGAGIETSSHYLSMTIYLIAEHP